MDTNGITRFLSVAIRRLVGEGLGGKRQISRPEIAFSVLPHAARPAGLAIAVCCAALLGSSPAAISAQVSVAISATTPHIADGTDRSTVTVTVTDGFGNPVTDAEVVLEIGPPTFIRQIAHFALHLKARNVGNGRYIASFASPVPGPIAVTATELGSLSNASTLVEFLPASCSPSSSSLRRAAVEPSDATPLSSTAEEPPLRDRCIQFFDKLDEQTYVPTLPEGQTREDMKKFEGTQGLIRKAIDIEVAKILKRDTTALEAGFKTARHAAIDSIKRISEIQKALLKEKFGDPIKFDEFQTCMELFTNFELANNFGGAIERIQKAKDLQGQETELRRRIAQEANPEERARLEEQLKTVRAESSKFRKEKIVTRGPDNSTSHIGWSQFANFVIGLVEDLKERIKNEKDPAEKAKLEADLRKIEPELAMWTSLKPILVKGTTITADVLTTKDGRKPMMLMPADVTAIRGAIHRLRPDQLDGKLRELIEKIFLKKGEVLAQLPGEGGDRVLVANFRDVNCGEGCAALPPGQRGIEVSLHEEDGVLFGIGADEAGMTYVAVGNVTGDEFSFATAGFGLGLGTGPALVAYQGTNQDGVVMGRVEATAVQELGINPEGGSGARAEDTCTWSGEFILTFSAAVTGLTGSANRVGSVAPFGRDAGAQVSIAEKFTFAGPINLGASTVTINHLLNEDGGSGELVEGINRARVVPMTLFARSGGDSTGAIFETPAGTIPKARMEIRAKGQAYDSLLRVDRANIPVPPSLCAGGTRPTTSLTTSFTMDDGVHPPVPVGTTQSWRCLDLTGGDLKKPRSLRAP